MRDTHLLKQLQLIHSGLGGDAMTLRCSLLICVTGGVPQQKLSRTVPTGGRTLFLQLAKGSNGSRSGLRKRKDEAHTLLQAKGEDSQPHPRSWCRHHDGIFMGRPATGVCTILLPLLPTRGDDRQLVVHTEISFSTCTVCIVNSLAHLPG